MAILHYIIGLPPLRKGGSVQYAFDLINEQAKSEKVFALTCGDTLIRSNKTKIKYRRFLDNVPVFILTNPLTPTLIYGTADPLNQYRNIEVDYENIKRFIDSNEIEVMHLHTLMGLHSKIVKFIKSLGVKIIYTSHDFHGICPHYNLINRNGELCHAVNPTQCAQCNIHEPSDKFLRIANSTLYQYIKRIEPLKSIGKSKLHINKNKLSLPAQIEISNKTIEEYNSLIDYYRNYFKLIDKFHFNSFQTKQVFKQFLPYVEGKVIPVITSGIKDRRKRLKLGDGIKFGFIGSLNEYKGFPLLKKVLTELYIEGNHNFKLLVYSSSPVGSDSDCPSIEYQPPYDYTQISEVMYNLDCMIIPSKWYETFSLVALEALAHGRPVIASDHVGAKDIIRDFAPQMIFNTPGSLKLTLKTILDNPEILLKYNERVCEGDWKFSLENHAKEITAYYYER